MTAGQSGTGSCPAMCKTERDHLLGTGLWRQVMVEVLGLEGWSQARIQIHWGAAVPAAGCRCQWVSVEAGAPAGVHHWAVALAA